MRRVSGWLAVLALAGAGRLYDADPLRALCVPAIVLLFAAAMPALRITLLALATALAAAVAAGFASLVVDLTPALVAGLVGWLFARTLRRGRRPLIARAIAAIDGPEPLQDPVVVRYARRLTATWAAWQGLLAAAALLLATNVRMSPPLYAALPGPRAFGVIVLPLAVAALALGEFALRPLLLPQAPRHGLFAFVRDLVRTWPAILNE